MLSDADIAGMRSTLNTLLPDTATISRKTTANVGGEETESWASIATGVACRIAPIGGGEAGAGGGQSGAVGGRVVDETTHIVTLAAGTDIEEADRVAIDGATYDVTLVRKRGAWELTRRVEVRET